MGLLEKLKNALFEEDEEEDVQEIKREKMEKHERVKINEEQIVKKIDVNRTTNEEPVIKNDLPSFQMQEFKIEEKPKGPIIFDDDDFLSDTKELTFKEVPKKEERILYGGYEAKEEIRNKEKFKPSPIISPVYGVLDKNYVSEEKYSSDKSSLDHLFVEERKKEVTFDTIRQKAFGEVVKEEVVIDDNPLLYEMQEHDERPGIEKITIGDAEEYFEDLGLEYEVDYKDMAKANRTRSKKNKELIDIIDEEINDDGNLEELKSLKDKDKAIVPNIFDDYFDNEAEEKNLYDLIDMMYESKE